MKVLYLTNIPSPYRVDFFNELGKYCELTVLYERSNASDRDKSWTSNKASHFTPVFMKGFKITQDSAICPSVIRWLRRDKYDAIVVGGYSTPTGMLAIRTLRARKIPFFLNIDGGFIKQDGFLSSKIKKYFIGSATWWLSSGLETNKYLRHYGADPDHIHVYPFTSLMESDIYPSGATDEERARLRSQLGIANEKVVLAVGQFIPRKGFDLLIDAWSSMPPDYRLILVGSGPDENEYKKRIAELGLSNIRIEGFKSKEELRSYYRSADLFVMPTREDIWGLVVNEALSCGLPVVSTDKCIAALEFARKSEGIHIVPADDQAALARTIRYACEDDRLRHEFSSAALRVMDEHTIEAMAQKHVSIFKECVS
ncbi:glycosyltransferase family 4 protein [Cohnella yongneupensis]|uniref:Glycosyltransferase family 4 protein n=1 Tax=Cohnella yongneupensis TaxID=425006 RepID=A0ABW0R2R7_9BACL